MRPAPPARSRHEILGPDAERASLVLAAIGGDLGRQRQPGVADDEVVAVDRAVEHAHRRTADERGYEPVRRPVVDLARGCELLQVALAHHGHQVGHRGRLGLVVGDVQRRDAELLLEPLDLTASRHPELGVEVRERLVHQEYRRLADDRPRQGDALALPARELPGAPVEQVVDLERPRHLFDAPPSRVAAEAADLERVADVLTHRHVRVERVALEHHRHVAGPRRQAGDVAIADLDGARRRASRARPGSAARWSCHSRTGRAGPRTGPPRRPGRASAGQPPHRRSSPRRRTGCPLRSPCPGKQ